MQLYFNEQIAKRFIPNPRFMSLGKAIELWLENMNPPPAILVDNETCTNIYSGFLLNLETGIT